MLTVQSKLWVHASVGSDGTFYQVKASAMSLMELVHDALLYPRETKCAPAHAQPSSVVTSLLTTLCTAISMFMGWIWGLAGTRWQRIS